MSVYRFTITPDNTVTTADASAELGKQADGGFVHEVFNCPQEAQIEDAAYLVAQAELTNGEYRHNFADLASGGTSCCGCCS